MYAHTLVNRISNNINNAYYQVQSNARSESMIKTYIYILQYVIVIISYVTIYALLSVTVLLTISYLLYSALYNIYRNPLLDITIFDDDNINLLYTAEKHYIKPNTYVIKKHYIIPDIEYLTYINGHICSNYIVSIVSHIIFKGKMTRTTYNIEDITLYNIYKTCNSKYKQKDYNIYSYKTLRYNIYLKKLITPESESKYKEYVNNINNNVDKIYDKVILIIKNDINKNNKYSDIKIFILDSTKLKIKTQIEEHIG